MLVRSVIFQSAYQAILLWAFASRSPIFMALYFLMTVVLLANSYNRFHNLSLPVKIIGLIFIGVTGVMATVNVFRYLPAAVFWVLGVMTYLSSVALFQEKTVYMKASGIVLYSFQVISLFLCLYFGFENFPWENPLEKIIPGASANGITSYVVILQINYSLCRYISGKKAPWLSLIFTMLIAVAGYGRGSVVSGLLIILLTFGMMFLSKDRYKAFFIGSIIISSIVGGYIKYKNDVDYFLLSKTKFLSAGIKSSHRDFMIKDYKAKINFGTILQGAGYEHTAITRYYHNNPHNSFIRAHNIFGLPYLIAIFLSPLFAFYFFKKWTHIIFSFFLFLVLALRCFSEPNLFPGIMDLFYFSLLLYPVSIKQNAE